MNINRISGLNLIASLIAALLIQGCANTPVAGGQRLSGAEKMMWSTYAIATEKGLGTCLVVNRRDPAAPHKKIPVLITAAHVLAAAPHGPFYIVIRTANGTDTPSIDVLEFRPPPGDVRPFFRHPTHDVAVLELTIPPELAASVSLPSYLDEEDIGRSADLPHAGDDVSLLGFPHVLPGIRGAFPVLRSGRIASRAHEPGAGTGRLLINAAAFGGDSGAPVFSAPRFGKPRLVGILSELIGDKEGIVPLAIAMSAPIVKETLRLQAEQQRFEVQVGPSEVTTPSGRTSGAQLLGPPQPLSKSAIRKLWQ